MSEHLFLDTKPRVMRVAELTRAINQLLEGNVPALWVRGEISNLVKAASGHWYFALKDEQAQVRCVMFRHKNQSLDNTIANGSQVELLAVASLYEARGDFQLTVEQLRPAGLGVLYEQFARLKQKLEDEGLFDAARKRSLPAFPRRVGIITSPQAAALRDVLTTLKRRLPGVPVILYPTPVQGAGSAEKIAAAIQTASDRNECSVLILCRGGGSIEDLWAFNEEAVARAIFASAIPIVSGVGHETDFTIADFVADERAPTPTAAAQRVVPDRETLLKGLRDTAQHLLRSQRNRLHNAMQSLDYLQRRVVHPSEKLKQKSMQLDQIQQRLQRNFSHGLQQEMWRCKSYTLRLRGAGSDFHRMQDKLAHQASRLVQAMQTGQSRKQVRLATAVQHLGLLNPQQVLARGYSLVQDGEGRLVCAAEHLAMGDALRITFASGWAKTEVTERGV
ncbi:MAG TPA: exodeoxyribonuclease VII large subunit [Gallionella sp.]|nr:MAG: exodeoxyribonuclease VII large subunit [Gallionellales bacterium GWA2_54_124]OGT17264.1 MAG: exodeoxyribonuclease VII large subunit [Gallionellales bacterium RIFOXYD12_FULL_53_10]HCI53051.1 exodeoxyribonuclease VII large subunit [Gallionella sp.]